MLSFVAAIAFSVAMGFVTAGICASAFQLVTNQRLRFEGPEGEDTRSGWHMAMLVIAGPVIILRNSWRAVHQGSRARAWLIASALFSSCWSFCLGLSVLNLVLAVGAVSG